ncbi:MAG: hypothetical protein GY754_43370 [bacterium]|nr:hypothetical protein [bacterium]
MNMHIKRSKKVQFLRIVICFAIVLLLGLYLAIFLYKTGLDNLKIFLNSSYSWKFIWPIAGTVLVMVVYTFKGLGAVRMGRVHWSFLKRYQKLGYIISVLLLGALVFGGIYIPIRVDERLNGKEPTAQKQYNAKIGPFLQFGPYTENEVASTSSSMVVWWLDPEKKEGREFLEYGKTSNPQEMKKAFEIEGGDGKRHEVHLQNLEPGTRYYYRVPGFADEKVYNFTTGPAAGEKTGFHFLAVGDASNHGGDKHSYHGEINSLASEFYKKNAIFPGFKINLGDIAHKGTDLKSWEVYFENQQEHSPYLSCMNTTGNHELYNDFGGNNDYFFNKPRYYSFDYGNAHFLVIHNFDGLLETVGKEQYQFIKKDLRQNKDKKWIIVTLHVPPISAGDFNMNELLIAQYRDLFRENRVDLVLMGHDHHYESFHLDKETAWGGTFYVVNGGGGSKVDHYIMTRKKKTWKTWYHKRDSEFGLYLNDAITEKSHLYGEISWGFMDIEITPDAIKTSYYRWMDIERFLKITGQTMGSWKMSPFSKEDWKKHKLSSIELIQTLNKNRFFSKKEAQGTKP